MATSSYVAMKHETVMDAHNEDRMLERAIEGDKRAFGALYEKHMSEIYRYFYYRVSVEQDAEDLTEQAFLNVWQALGRFDPDRASFRTYLYRVAHNLLVDHYRTAKPTEELPDAPLEDFQASAEPQPSREDFGMELTSALRKLNPDYQEILTLRFVNELSHAEAAQVMDRSHGAVRVLQHRALEALRQVLEGESGQ